MTSLIKRPFWSNDLFDQTPLRSNLFFSQMTSLIKRYSSQKILMVKNDLRKKLRQIILRRKIFRSKNVSSEVEDSSPEYSPAGYFFARKILRRDNSSPENSSLEKNIPRRRKILRRSILHLHNSSPNNSSLRYFFARKILRRKVFSLG
jgi:hypothetical protein